MRFTYSFFITYLLPRYATSNRAKVPRAQNNLRASQSFDSPIICTLFNTCHTVLPGEAEIEPTFRCVTDDGKVRAVTNIPEDFFQIEGFQSGETQISVLASGISERTSHRISDAVSRHEVIDITAGSGNIVSNSRKNSRSLSLNMEGDFSLAVIRVSDTHAHSPDDTAAEISDHIFGTGGNSLSMVTGYQECSGGKVNFNPATGPSFSGGIMDLTLTRNIAGLLSEDVEYYVTNELDLTSGFDQSTYTNIMYIFPSEVDFEGFSGYAYQNGRISVISSQYVSNRNLLIYEIGHNFGHHHSGQGNHVYGDETGIMGRQVYKNESPRACFNAAKSWWFGWYSDRHVEVTPTSGSMVLNMLSIDDYLNDHVTSDEQYTVAHIVEANEEDLFVMYNRAEGINSQVLGHRDQVTIIKQNGRYEQSWLEAGISLDNDVPSRWISSDWNGSGNDLVIQICDRVDGTPDYARIIVYLEGVNDISCDNTCGAGMSEFKAGVFTDSWGDETGWWLKQKEDTGFSNVILRDKYLPSNIYVEKKSCISQSKCYKFKIRDEGQDGICCQEGNGWYHIKINDAIIKYSTFEGLSNEVTEFCL